MEGSGYRAELHFALRREFKENEIWDISAFLAISLYIHL